MKKDARLYVALALAGVAGVLLLRRSLPALSLPNLADFIPSAASVRDGAATAFSTGLSYADNAAAGAVEGIGLAVGIPRTNVSQCQADKAAGRWWDASFSCTATDFVSSGVGAVFGSTRVQEATQADVRRIDNAIDYTDSANPFQNSYGTDFRYF